MTPISTVKIPYKSTVFKTRVNTNYTDFTQPKVKHLSKDDVYILTCLKKKPWFTLTSKYQQLANT